jgi:ankyrin repeat protein
VTNSGADPESERADGVTPLHAAAAFGCVNVVEQLLAKGVSHTTIILIGSFLTNSEAFVWQASFT